MKIAYLANASPASGVGHYAAQLAGALEEQERDIALDKYFLDGRAGALAKNGERLAGIKLWPGPLRHKTANWVRLGRIAAKDIALHSDARLIHATNQTLSFIRSHLPTVVTVHDIIELQEPQSPLAKLAAQYLYRGIASATHIIAVSHFTAAAIQEYYDLPPERITVVHNGVSSAFYPILDFTNTVAEQAIRQELRLASDNKVILYVGSDHPRKNVRTAVRAFQKVREKFPQAIFVKVGEPGLPAGREKLLTLLDELKLRDYVRFVGNVPETRLNELYNLADVFVYPSRFEGFGLPPLQAMAAGTPVITSTATSIPEVVGEAALTNDPKDIDGLADDIRSLLEHEELAEGLIKKGLAQAQQFSWAAAAKATTEVYKKALQHI